MVKTGTKQKAKEAAAFKAHKDYLELEYIIEQMANAMRNADKEYIARRTSVLDVTPNMRMVLYKFHMFCEHTYAK